MPNLNGQPIGDKPRISAGLVREATSFQVQAGLA